MGFGTKHFLIELFKPSFILLNVTLVYILCEHLWGRTPLLLLEDQCKIVYLIKNNYIVLQFGMAMCMYDMSHVLIGFDHFFFANWKKYTKCNLFVMLTLW